MQSITFQLNFKMSTLPIYLSFINLYALGFSFYSKKEYSTQAMTLENIYLGILVY